MPPIPARMCLKFGDYTDVRVRPGGLWISAIAPEIVETNDNQYVTKVLRMWRVADNATVDILATPTPLGGHGMGGGVHAWNPRGDAVVVSTYDSGLVLVTLDDDRVASTTPLRFARTPNDGRWFTPEWSADGRRIAATIDSRTIAVIDIESQTYSEIDAPGAFAFDAAWHGNHPTCHTWDRPEMPWTRSRIVGVTERFDCAVQQPRSSVDGRSFGYISDENGVANVVVEPDHVVDERIIITDECEHGGAVWGPGQRTWCFNDDGTMVAYTRNEGGFGSLYVHDRRTGERTMVGRAVHNCVSWSGNTLAAIRSGARTPQQVVVYDMTTPTAPSRLWTMSLSWHDWSEHDEDLVEPTRHHVTDGASEVHYRLYSPHESTGRLICYVHGGPVDQWQVTFRPRLNYWLSRGFAVALVDTRGSAGFGRRFTHSLHGQWGVADSHDMAAALHDLYSRHGFSPHRTVLSGGSSGGVTVLATLRDHAGIAACAVVSYPVVDFGEMLTGTDPFEGHYMPTLIGTDDPSSELVRHRSINMNPGHLVDTPILVFHGDMDTSVPLEHSTRLVAAVNGNGGHAELVVMYGEGHGFSKDENVLHEFDATEAFVHHHLH